MGSVASRSNGSSTEMQYSSDSTWCHQKGGMYSTWPGSSIVSYHVTCAASWTGQRAHTHRDTYTESSCVLLLLLLLLLLEPLPDSGTACGTRRLHPRATAQCARGCYVDCPRPCALDTASESRRDGTASLACGPRPV